METTTSVSATTAARKARPAAPATVSAPTYIDLDNLKKWKPSQPMPSSPSKQQGSLTPLQSAFRKGFSPGESMNSLQSEFMGDSVLRPNVEWKQVLLAIVGNLDKRNKMIITVEPPDMSQCILIDLLGSAKEPNIPNVSFSDEFEGAKSPKGEKGKNDTENGIENEQDKKKKEQEEGKQKFGPVIPCRVMYGSTNDTSLNKQLAAIRGLLWDKGEGYVSLHIPVSSVETMQLGIKYFQDASGKITPKCMERFRASAKSYDGAFELSFLYVPQGDKRMKLDKVQCDNRGCAKDGTKRCSMCRTAYCSKECQVACWKNGHKEVCESRARGEHSHDNGSPTSDRSSVLLDPKAKPAGPLGEQPNRFAISVSGETRGYKMGKDRLMYRDHEFIVKVQGPIGPVPGFGPLMIYDEKRTFFIDADGRSGPGMRIFAFTASVERPNASPAVLAQKGFHPEFPPVLKCFLYARTEKDGLRVFIDKLAPWQKW